VVRRENAALRHFCSDFSEQSAAFPSLVDFEDDKLESETCGRPLEAFSSVTEAPGR